MYPEYVEVEGKRYKINTDYRVAIECGRIAEDNSIGELERALGIIYLLYGEEGLNSEEHYEKLLELAKKYLSCGKELQNNNGKPDMSFIEDMDYIEASFMSDYNIWLPDIKMHWWKFFNLMNGLSNSELGNCCILNRIRNLRNYDTSKIKDSKEKDKIRKAQQQVALHKNSNITEKQRQSAMELYEALGLGKE